MRNIRFPFRGGRPMRPQIHNFDSSLTALMPPPARDAFPHKNHRKHARPERVGRAARNLQEARPRNVAKGYALSTLRRTSFQRTAKAARRARAVRRVAAGEGSGTAAPFDVNKKFGPKYDPGRPSVEVGIADRSPPTANSSCTKLISDGVTRPFPGLLGWVKPTR